jgi:hypothetical protein
MGKNVPTVAREDTLLKNAIGKFVIHLTGGVVVDITMDMLIILWLKSMKRNLSIMQQVAVLGA